MSESNIWHKSWCSTIFQSSCNKIPTQNIANKITRTLFKHQIKVIFSIYSIGKSSILFIKRPSIRSKQLFNQQSLSLFCNDPSKYNIDHTNFHTFLVTFNLLQSFIQTCNQRNNREMCLSFCRSPTFSSHLYTWKALAKGKVQQKGRKNFCQEYSNSFGTFGKTWLALIVYTL